MLLDKLFIKPTSFQEYKNKTILSYVLSPNFDPGLPFHAKTEQTPRRHIALKLLWLTWQCLWLYAMFPTVYTLYFRQFMFFYYCFSKEKMFVIFSKHERDLTTRNALCAITCTSHWTTLRQYVSQISRK